MERERAWHDPAEKLKQQGTLAIKGKGVTGPASLA
jgi:hypothetical protein